MSVNYATGLSDYPNKGVCGLPEVSDSEAEISTKLDELCSLITESRYTVVHTGAGISTSVGIPDFRGPKGVWTLEKLGLPPSISVSFESAQPSMAHCVLVELERRNLIQYLITQNIDGLHFRSGFPRDRLSILHGDMFLERCGSCSTLFARETASKTMGLKRTSVSCSYVKKSKRTCRGKLFDSILDWENDLPEPDYSLAIEHSNLADLHICIGTSLQMYPAASLPLLPNKTSLDASLKRDPSKLVIINLQKTKLDNRANIKIHAPADRVMLELAHRLHISVPPPQSRYPPSLYLRSIHSDLSITSPWRILPHPTDGENIQIFETFDSKSPKGIKCSLKQDREEEYSGKRIKLEPSGDLAS